MKFFFSFFILIHLALPTTGLFAAEVIDLKDPDKEYFLTQEVVDIIEDHNHELTIHEISSLAFQSKFTKLKTYYLENETPGAAYWVRFTVKNSSIGTSWLLESFNFKVNELALYSPLADGSFREEIVGFDHPFTNRKLNHKNFEFLFPELTEKPKTYYIKVIVRESMRTRLVFRSHNRFISYALNEYFFLGLFYGMIIIIMIYNTFLYLRLKDLSYFYYGIYVIFVGIFSLGQDGLGFQYIWSKIPHINPHIIFTASTGMVVFLLLYTRSFLDTKNQFPIIHKLIFYVIIVRIIFFFIELVLIPEFANLIWIDIFPYIIAYVTSITAYKRNNETAFYFVLGFTILFIGFSFNTLRIFKLIPSNLITVYILNITALIEMLLLSLALSERVKKIKENEMLKESINKELEEKVRERTEAILIQKNIIEEKAKTLDNFIYKASHDIKGPLKSLIGITTLGMKDTPDNAHIYFDHALKTTRKLDAIVKDLLHIGQITNKKRELEEIKFEELISDILESFKSSPDFEKVKFESQVINDSKFFSEKPLIYSIIQNFIENGIKYRNPDKNDSYFNIRIHVTPQICEMEFSDNGLGIPEEYQEKVFEMFFKTDYSSEDSSGLGLYIVKLSVEKLNGHLLMDSKPGKGTTFKVIFKNQSAEPAPLFN